MNNREGGRLYEVRIIFALVVGVLLPILLPKLGPLGVEVQILAVVGGLTLVAGVHHLVYTPGWPAKSPAMKRIIIFLVIFFIFIIILAAVWAFAFQWP